MFAQQLLPCQSNRLASARACPGPASSRLTGGRSHISSPRGLYSSASRFHTRKGVGSAQAWLSNQKPTGEAEVSSQLSDPRSSVPLASRIQAFPSASREQAISRKILALPTPHSGSQLRKGTPSTHGQSPASQGPSTDVDPNTAFEDKLAASLEDGVRRAGEAAQEAASEVSGVVAARAGVLQDSFQSRASGVQAALQERAFELQEQVQERAAVPWQELQEKAADVAERLQLQQRAAGVAERLQERQAGIEKAVQERAMQVEQRLSPDTQKALRTSVVKEREFVASVGQLVRTFPVSADQLGFTLAAVFLLVKLAMEWWRQTQLDSRGSTGFDVPERPVRGVPEPPPPPAPVALMFAQPDLRRKEPVEWLNMILLKIWKVYREGLERWMVTSLQPSLDDMEKPSWVQRVRITQYFLGDEPPSLRTIERRTSRRSNDLQYYVGFRYTGNQRMTLEVPILIGNRVPFTIPVGIRDIDIDAEMWVKLKLIPTEPWVGTMTWAFVALPKVKLTIAPFKVLNLMAVPFLAQFLEKLFTVNLPAKFVRPNCKVVDLLKARKENPFPPVSPQDKDRVFRDFEGSEVPAACRSYEGELQITLIAAKSIPVFPGSRSDPYVVMELGEHVVRSKKNSETSVKGPRGAPIWNQDFQLMVVNQANQDLVIKVIDKIGPLTVTLGHGELKLRPLQDTVPMDLWVPLRAGLPPLYEMPRGEVKLRVTYKEFVEEEEDGIDEPLPRPEDKSPGVEAGKQDTFQLPSSLSDAVDMELMSQLPKMFSDGSSQGIGGVVDLAKLGEEFSRVAQRIQSPDPPQDRQTKKGTTPKEEGRVFPAMEEYFRLRRKAGMPGEENVAMASLGKILPTSLTKDVLDVLKHLDGPKALDGLKLDLSSIQDTGFLASVLELMKVQGGGRGPSLPVTTQGGNNLSWENVQKRLSDPVQMWIKKQVERYRKEDRS